MPNKSIEFAGSSLKIKEFKMENMKDHAAIAMIAKRGSGKSWVCRDILRQKSNIPCGMIIAPTDKMNGFYNDFFAESFIHYDFDPILLQRLLYRQELIIEKAEEKAKQGKHINPDAFLIMDDCMSKKKSWIKDDTISEIFMNGRHYKLTYMLTMQFSLGISPELRTNFDYVFLLGDDAMSNQKRLYEHYASMFPTFESFQVVFNELTDNFGCMVIDNKVKSKKLTDKIYWYKATSNDKPFKVGSDKFRKFNRENYDPEWRKRKPKFDMSQMMSRRSKKCNFIVSKI